MIVDTSALLAMVFKEPGQEELIQKSQWLNTSGLSPQLLLRQVSFWVRG